MFKRRVKHKFGAKRATANGIKFPSKLEARYFQKLNQLVAAGEVVMFLRQPLFDLPGGNTYRADFLEFWKDGTVRVVDVKGMPETESFKIKKRLVEEAYPVEIEIIKKV